MAHALHCNLRILAYERYRGHQDPRAREESQVVELFSTPWLARYKALWNAEPELADALARVGFEARIGYGYKGENDPRALLVVENGHVAEARPYAGELLDWDLRADAETWARWQSEPPGMVGLGIAYTTSRMQFVIGDYAAMIKDPRMAAPFMKSFVVMSRV